jgi:two-component system sensor histidine kinase PilS (NtrC family)
MISSEPKIIQSELSGRLLSLMFLRVIFVSLLLGASIFIHVKETQTYFGHIQTFHYMLIAIVYFLTFVYAFVLKYSQKLFFFAYLQLLLDVLFVTAVLYSTGGIESIFSSLYFLCIIYGSIMLYRKGGMMVASLSSILYGLLLDLHYYGVIDPLGSRLSYPEQYQSSYLLFIILVNIVAFYVVAFLSSYVSEQARKSSVLLKAKQIDVDKLEILNESIVNSITAGLIAVDGYSRIILFNPAAEEIFKIDARGVFGRQVRDALPFLNDYLPDGAIPAVKGTGKFPLFVDLPYVRSNGEKVHLRLSISPLRLLLGKQEGHILIFQDLTEIKKIEEEMKKVEGLAMIGELAAAIAHEIRNPMASISGSIQMLKDGLKEDNVNNRLMEIVSREINRLNHLVNDFLLFARPKKAKLVKFDLNQLILESLELFKNRRQRTDDIKVLTDFHSPIILESDPEQVKQVLWNLFLNSCEAMPHGGSLHVLTAVEQDASQPHVKRAKISVRDTGSGFDEETLSQLFVPFFTTKEGGSGLGLATVKRIVEDLQGRVHGGNYPEGGAEIVISFPVSPSDFTDWQEN